MDHRDLTPEAKPEAKYDPYATENLRFRKAYIRDRLNAMKEERLALLAEREEIDLQLQVNRDQRVDGPKPSSPATDVVERMDAVIEALRGKKG